MVDLPTPPLPDETQTTCLTCGMRRGCGGPEPRRGMVGGMRWLFRGRPSGFSCERVAVVAEKGLLEGPATGKTIRVLGIDLAESKLVVRGNS